MGKDTAPLVRYRNLDKQVRARLARGTDDATVPLALLLNAMQGFLEDDIHAVIRVPGNRKFARYSQPVEDVQINDQRIRDVLRSFGVHLLGEVPSIRFDRRKSWLADLENRILAEVGLTKGDAPIQEGWQPPYWSDPTFLAALNTPCIEYFGNSLTLKCWRPNVPFAFAMHTMQRHCMGDCLRYIRSRFSVSGKLQDVRILMGRAPCTTLWPTAHVPTDWKSPPDTPEAWTRELAAIA